MARSQPPAACTASTPRCAAATSYHHATPACCLSHIRALVFAWADLCAELAVTWWLDYGTLLGAVRNGGVIPHDKDADLGVPADDFRRVLAYRPEVPWADRVEGGKRCRVRLVDGLWWIHKLRHGGKYSAGNSLKIRLSEVNHTNVDVFPWYPEPNDFLGRQAYVGCDRYKGREFPATALFPLSEIEWEGRWLPAPRDPEAFLHHRYGPDWRTPIPRNNEGKRIGDGWQGPPLLRAVS